MNSKLAWLALFVAPLSFVAAQQPLEIAVVPKMKNGVYWDLVHAGATKAQTELGVNVRWEGPDREDQTDAQAAIVAKCVERKVAAIVLAPANAQALVPAVDQAKAAGIPVIVVDSLLASDVPVATVATNNYRAGMLAGRRLAETLGGKGKVALFRYMKGHGSTQPREAGFLDALKKFPGIQVVSSDMYAGDTEDGAQKNAAALLAKYGADLQGVFASNLYGTDGMLAALRSAGLAGKIAFVGFDGSDPLFAALRKGEINSIAVQQPVMMGVLAVRAAVAAAQHKPVDKQVDTDVMIVTKDNVDTPAVQALLNPAKS